MTRCLFSMALLLLLLTMVFHRNEACANTALNRDAEVITDPTFTFSISPPVRWTYFPPVITSGAQQVTNFFPGQSTSSADALQAAQNEIMAAFLEALSQLPVSTVGVTTAVTYSPDEISNCYTTQPIPAGTRIGYLAGGAITQVALVNGQTATATTCPLSQTMQTTGIGPYEDYQKAVTITTRGGTTMSRYNWERVAAQMQSVLNFRYRALFRTPLVIGNN